MPLAERLRSERRAAERLLQYLPGSDALLISGNGSMNIESAVRSLLRADSFSRHESLFIPCKRPFEAPKVAGIFPQVRQMLLDGKYHEATEFGFKEWQKAPMPRTGRSPDRPGILDASGFSEVRGGEGLSPHSRFRKHRGEGVLEGRARRLASPDLHVPARQCRGPVTRRPERTTAECSNRTAKVGGRRSPLAREEDAQAAGAAAHRAAAGACCHWPMPSKTSMSNG